MRVPRIPDLSVFQNQPSEYDGLIAGLSQLFSGFSSAIGKRRSFRLADDAQGRTLGSFLSVLTGGKPTQPVMSVTPGGVRRIPT